MEVSSRLGQAKMEPEGLDGEVAPVLDKVREFIAANELFLPGERVGVAVSGGIDSVCLLHVLMSLRDLALALSVCHIDHGLRTESARDAAFVRDLAAQHGVPFIQGGVDVRSHARAHRVSLEMAARTLRYAELRRMAAESGLDRIALGHHRGDQVETVLLRILRGAGLEGLAGMAASREEGRFVRPLLAVSREEILAFAREHGLAWVEDVTNQETAIPRNRVRHQLLPGLRADFNPGIDRALLGLAALARETVQYLETQLAAVWPHLGVEKRAGGIVFTGAALAEMPAPLARLALRRLLALAGGDPGRLSLAATDRLWRFVLGAGGPRLSVPGGFQLARRRDVLALGRCEVAPRLAALELAVPGWVTLADGRSLVASWWDGNPPPWPDVNNNEAFIDSDRIIPPLVVRSRRPGDRFYPLGLGAAKKVKEILLEAGVPREERNTVPVMVDGHGAIVWLAGIRLDHRFRVTAETGRVLHLVLRGQDGPLC